MTQAPIYQTLPELLSLLSQHHQLVLQAPPGAGKTTIVPLALESQPWCSGKVIMLEPRRVAARAAAEHMARSLGEKVGERVGYRMRQESKVSDATRVEIVTEGVFLRLLQADPALEKYSVIVFDEFHERSLDADLGLSLCLQARTLFRDDEPLKILVMSATLNGEQISEFLNHAPIVSPEGKAYPLDIRYRGQCKRSELVEEVCATTRHALQAEHGDVLVFLPGKKQILQALKLLQASVAEDVLVCPLFGSLALNEQMQAINKLPANAHFKRKVVLATDIAETSVTIEGVRVVIDGGYRREPSFDKNTGLTRLQTTRISKASATQRAGRAGRMEAGVCYRMWSPEQILAPFSKAEIEQADLTPLLLSILDFGLEVTHEGGIDRTLWLTPPPAHGISQALALLQALKAIDTKNGYCFLNTHGSNLSKFPAHPRLAHMMVLGAQRGLGPQAALLAAALSEANRPVSLGTNIANWMIQLPKLNDPWSRRVRIQAKNWNALLPNNPTTNVGGEYEILLPLAYPDRIARKRPGSTSYLMSNGRSVVLPRGSQLDAAEWLCAAEIASDVGSAEDRIYSALTLNEALFENELAALLTCRDAAHWDSQQGRFVAETRWFVGRIIYRSETGSGASEELISSELIAFIRREGIEVLALTKEIEQWRARIQLMTSHPSCNAKNLPNWPDLSDGALLDSLETWLAPHLNGITSLKALKKLDFKAILQGFLPWPLPRKLEEWAPTHVEAPSGSTVKIDYLHDPPILAVKLQEMFGCQQTPTIANGSVALMVHLLSPARRPLQITQDLLGFWQNGYHDVKKEMKGRYPKHPWPDNPLDASPTRWTKQRSN